MSAASRFIFNAAQAILRRIKYEIPYRPDVYQSVKHLEGLRREQQTSLTKLLYKK